MSHAWRASLWRDGPRPWLATLAAVAAVAFKRVAVMKSKLRAALAAAGRALNLKGASVSGRANAAGVRQLRGHFHFHGKQFDHHRLRPNDNGWTIPTWTCPSRALAVPSTVSRLSDSYRPTLPFSWQTTSFLTTLPLLTFLAFFSQPRTMRKKGLAHNQNRREDQKTLPK
jgi:hypothetical protein